MSFQRKFNKLKKNPRLFFLDMYRNLNRKMRQYLPIKYNGQNQYTVVSAVYNVAPYLDDYFNSLVKQTLDFKKHIYLILVDDGSTDDSAKIIQQWQKKYPANIFYVRKENGGIASARNLGCQYVVTKWVTFIDSDDFVDFNYFKIVDDAISSDESIKLAVGNLHFYFDENKSIQDSHSLRYRFQKKEKNLVPIDDLDNNINLFVTVSFFQTNILRENHIQFDEKIKPNFEDGKFLADYLLCAETGSVAYLQKAEFFYRKRGNGSSTIDGSWLKKEKYYNLFAFGYLPMLHAYQQKYGFAPKNIQWTVLYEICWHIKTLLNSDYKIDGLLNDEEIKVYRELVCETLAHIDDKHIVDFDLIGIWFFYKVGLLGMKGTKPPFHIVYVENIDREKQQVLLVYQYVYEHGVSFRLNQKDVLPQYHKIVDYSFAKQVFVHEARVWLPYESVEAQLSVQIDNRTARLSLFGKQKDCWQIKDILAEFQPSEKYQTDGSWMVMDRDIQADDNAEHFYRYMMKHHPEQKCYFALNRDSHDWQRLEQEGFQLLDFATPEYEQQLKAASKIISSHFDEYVQNYFGDEYEHSKKFVFLQHGIIINNLSRWMNYKRNLSLFVTSTYDEFHAIANHHTPYQVGRKEVVLTGLARHDALIGKQNDEKIILIMPTWRANILGKASKTGNARELNAQFMQSEYAQCWGALLKGVELKRLAEKYAYQIIFAPHANIEPYLSMFDVPSHIQIWGAKTSELGIQQLFQKASLMITDYSSVAFEMGFLGKSVLYYQFDKDAFFSGSHIAYTGYFEYEKHGFGAVVYDEATLYRELEAILANQGIATEPYASRMASTFPFRDGQNCERIYQAIMALDEPDKHINLEIALSALQQAMAHCQHDLLVSRYELLLECGFARELLPYQAAYEQALQSRFQS